MILMMLTAVVIISSSHIIISILHYYILYYMNTERNAIILLSVHHFLSVAPLAVRVSPQVEVRAQGSAVEFTCSAAGGIDTKIEWLKEGSALPPNHHVKDGVLRSVTTTPAADIRL